MFYLFINKDKIEFIVMFSNYYEILNFNIILRLKNSEIGDWGLGIGDWGLGIGPNPQSPIPNPQSPSPCSFYY